MMPRFSCATAVALLLCLLASSPAGGTSPAGSGAGAGPHATSESAVAPATDTAPMPGVVERVLRRPQESTLPSDFVPVSINISYPAFGLPAIDADIETWATGIADAFENHFDSTVLAPAPMPELPDGDGGEMVLPAVPTLYLQGSYTVTRPSANALSVTFELWNHTGPGSDNLDVITLNYSTINGQRLDLVDIFELPERALILMSRHAREVLGRTLGGRRLTTGTEPLPENFASITLTPTGVRIHFQPYQVAGWEMGAQQVDMPLEALAPAGPLLILWGK